MIEDLRKQRSGNSAIPYPGVIGKGPGSMYAQYQYTGQLPKVQQGPMYLPHGTPMLSQGQGSDGMSTITSSFGGMNLQSPPFASSNKPNSSMSTLASEYTGLPVGPGMPFMYHGQLMFAGHHLAQAAAPNHTVMSQTPAMYASLGPQYLSQANFPGYQQHMVDNSPPSQVWPGSRVSSGEVPSLATPRRSSSSSNEQDIPGTPFTQYTGYGDYRGGVAVVDQSPHSLYGNWSPSPPNVYGKTQVASPVPPRIQVLVQQHPPIPRAIPAPFSPMKPLDRSLENPNGVTNVYVRGLLPDTNDEILHKLASRFGEIVSSKAIIDLNTGTCKGFGFIKYHNFKDAEDCIRGFHCLGYETSFARESFYSQLKKLSDEDNTNLYVSNLPKDMNEHELGAIFSPHKVCSSRILRDSAGNGRGVGFARFESRNACEDVIKAFNNTPIAKNPGEEHLVQIRYADTQDQKQLKQQTTLARQYRTAEYEQQTQARGSFYSARLNAVSSDAPASDGDFESYLQNTTGYNIPYNPARNGRASNVLSNLSSQLAPQSAYLGPQSEHPVVVNVNLPPSGKTEQDAYPASIEATDKAVASSMLTAVKVEGSAAAGATSTGRD